MDGPNLICANPNVGLNDQNVFVERVRHGPITMFDESENYQLYAFELISDVRGAWT